MTSDSSQQLDPQILQQWYATYEVHLRAFLVGLLRDTHQADEALQATMSKALTHGGTVAVGKEKAWLYQVAFREAMQIRRRQGVTTKTLQKLSREVVQASYPTDNLLQQELKDTIQNVLNQLPKEQQQIIRLRMQEEKTFQEIADTLDQPLGTVLTRMRLALQQLRQALKEFDV